VKAMILAAGLGKRMMPLTDKIPKPLLKVDDKSLLEHHILNLVSSGITEIVINHSVFGEQIEQAIGDGSDYDATIVYSPEPIRMETAGGIIKALPLLGDSPFLVVNADIWTDYPFEKLVKLEMRLCHAHLVLVKNVEHNPGGDFYLDDSARVHSDPHTYASDDAESDTFSGISVLHRDLFENCSLEAQPLVPLLIKAMESSQVSGEIYNGLWMDIGTPERLHDLRAALAD